MRDKAINYKVVLILAVILLYVLIRPYCILGALVSECQDRDYKSQLADLVVIGKITTNGTRTHANYVETKNIYTHNELQIGKYIKGEPVKADKIVIVTKGGCVRNFCQSVEDEARFSPGAVVKVYLQKIEGAQSQKFSVVCGELGVEELNSEEWYQIERDKYGPLWAVRTAQEKGELTAKQAVILKARLSYAPHTIDPKSEFALKPGEKVFEQCGTPFLKELHKVFPELTDQEKELLKSLHKSLRSFIESLE